MPTLKLPSMAHLSWIWAPLAAVFSSLFWVLSIPPFDFAEAAYIAFCPLLFWLYTKPKLKTVFILGFIVGLVSWCAILIWLRHVTWFGTITLSSILGCFFALWLMFTARVIRVMIDRGFTWRVTCFLGVAGLWVVFEWVRSWFLWGFPWAPLSLSQWERPVVLQVASWTGAYGVSFMLVFFNCCVAQTLRSRILHRSKELWSGWFSPDLYLALGALGFCIYLFFNSLPQRESSFEMFYAAVVQPYIEPTLKWDRTRELENLDIVETQTRFISNLESDVVLWPEAATPWPVKGDPRMQNRTEDLVDEVGVPILMGNLSFDQATELWHNGIFLVEPENGLSLQTYAKRELVPFGEYVPPPFGFIEKIVPFEGSFAAGESVGLIDLSAGKGTWRVGPLVCYEDVFPSLARDSVRAGAQLLFVATNNAWYGEEGGAEQHAAHSVLRAVENRRPVLRAGNGGWSGWIDAYGTVRDILTDQRGSVYFRGGGAYRVYHYEEWRTKESFYTQRGDWFVLVCAALFVGAALGARKEESVSATKWS